MKVQVMDSAGQMIEATVDDARYAIMDEFVTTHKESLIIPPAGYSAQGFDVGEAMSFLTSQLAHTEGKVFERLRTPMQNEKFIPQRFDAGEHVDTIRYEVMDYVGDADDASPQGNAPRTVDVAWAQVDYGVRDFDIAYSYTTHDLRVSAFLRKPLPEAKLTAAIQTYKRKMNQVGLFGNSAYGLEGLYNNHLVPVTTLPYGNWTGVSDTDQMLADLHWLLYAGWVGSANNTVPNQLILPSRAYTLAQQRRLPNTQVTVLNFFLENNLARDQGFDLSVDPGFGLETAGVGGIPRAMAYVRDEDHVVQHIPMPLRFLAPQPRGKRFEITGEARYCGTHIRYVNSAVYGDGLVLNPA